MKRRALIISCFDWYKNRLEPIQEILQKRYDVTILLSDYDHIRKAQTERYPDCSYLHVPTYRKNVSIKRIWSHFCFGRAVNRQIKRLQPDLIYLLLPPNYTALYCLRYRRTHPAVHYYIDLIDLWPESFPNEHFKGTFLSKIWSKLRDDSVREADHIFTECDLYRQKLSPIIKNSKRATTLYLFRDQSLNEYELVLQKIKKSKGKDKNHLSIAYLGSINNIIDIDEICWVIRTLIKAKYEVEIKIIGNGENRDAFLTLLENEGAQVQYYGEIYEQLKKIELLGDCNYALNIMRKEISVGLTIKSIDYLSMGLPLINNISGDTWELIEKENIGINVNKSSDYLIKKIQQEINHLSVLCCFQNNFSKSSFIQTIYNEIV